MPVSTDHRQSKRCRQCEEGNHGDSVYWNIQLDQDLLNTIVSIYPEWFKGLKPNIDINNIMAQGGNTSTAASTASAGGGPSLTSLCPRSPPKAEVDESPLQKSMDRNKEALKVKLMLRRPITQLVAQGIMPQLKTSPTIHEQRQKLERAKMGDLLKAKIQQRPDRQELVRQHILEADVGHVDPSLAERQRMLKKCRLVDSLNDQLSHRPGPLELIKKNILHTEEPIERAVKEGHIEFKATSEGQKNKPEPPDHYMTIDDDSQSSDAQSPRDGNSLYSAESPPSSSASSTSSSSSTSQPVQTAMITPMDTSTAATATVDLFRSSGSDMLKTAAAQAGIVTVVVAPNTSILATAPSPLSLGSSTSSLSPLSSIASPSSVTACGGGSAAATFTCSSPAAAFAAVKPSLGAHQQQPAPGKDKNRKKSKSKVQQQKTRTIKFHEYKGPPSAQKTSTTSSSVPISAASVSPNSETSYELLLQQQQLFLQWQLELQQKYPQILLPVKSESNPASPSVISLSSPSPLLSTPQAMDQSSSPPPEPPPPPPLPPPPPPPMPAGSGTPTLVPIKPLRNLEDMKVSDLKAELKKRNLRVSGAKTHLIERLKPYAENGVSNSSASSASSVCQTSNQNTVQTNFAIPFNDDSIPDTSASSPMSQVSQSTTTVEQTENTSLTTSPLNQNMDTCSANLVVVPSPMETSVCVNGIEPTSDEDIIRDQQRRIEELQRQLLNSQILLQQQRQQQQLQQQARASQTFQPQQGVNAKASLAAFIQQQQLNNAIAQHQEKLQKQIQQQQQQMQQVVLNTNNNNNGISHNNATATLVNGHILPVSVKKSNPKVAIPNHNVNVMRNINNNIVIKPTSSKNATPIVHNGSTNNNVNACRQRSNTVILGEHPATLLLNHVIKSEGNHQRTISLPNFVGTFVQPHLVLSSQGMKQLVFDPESVILPDNLKVQNGFFNGATIVTTAGAPAPTNVHSTITPNGVKPQSANMPTAAAVVNQDVTSTPQVLLGNENYVTLHIPEDEGMVTNELDVFNQNEEISKLFKQEPGSPPACVDDVLELLMKSGEFSAPTESHPVQYSQQPVQQPTQAQPPPQQSIQRAPPQPMDHAVSDPVSSQSGVCSGEPSVYANSNIESGIPSQHLSLEELGIDMETFPMDLNEERATMNAQSPAFMDVDNDWLDRLISSELEHPATNASATMNSNNYDSLLNNNVSDPLDLFNMDDNDYKIAAELSWDRVC